MPIRIEMPRLSDTMEEGTLLKWRVNVGDKVSAGDVLAEVETDKATMEVQAFDDGKVARLAVEEGQTTPVGSVILILAEEGESEDDAAAADDGNGGKPAEPADDEKEAEAESEDQAESQEAQGATEKASKQSARQEQSEPAATTESAEAKPDRGRIRVSPVARRIAEEKGLDLNRIEGSGPDGRIIKRDVLAAVEKAPATETAGAPAPAAPAGGLESRKVTLTNMRKTIAKRLVESKTTIPHFQVSMQVNMDPLLELRKTLNEQLSEQGVKLSVNDFIVRACAHALVQHPVVNSSWGGDVIEQHGTVNIGVAVALPEEKGGGLVVPVIRDVQNLSVRAIGEQTRKLAEKARDQGLSLDEMADSTFTLSNLGMFGVDQFNAIINPPNAAILAVGAALKKPVVRDDQLTIGHEMSATLSCDHRVVDGAAGAEFLRTLKNLLEHPALMLI